ncbi:hypothetical protein LL965_07645 [Xanthomonas cassavae CFBP 4642]|uniref:Uncharacterized protein n=1 Tax=Xanthomonas cassavae CFBP 4642 TaxID=1219375 RepID=A0ABS8HCT3_9XANT|nr:hypothetical protein [Xanthomonas cassavae]MCC4619968.1 hypothetical protein [Xanthomonas cassavae CFBP 4642]
MQTLPIDLNAMHLRHLVLPCLDPDLTLRVYRDVRRLGAAGGLERRARRLRYRQTANRCTAHQYLDGQDISIPALHLRGNAAAACNR